MVENIRTKSQNHTHTFTRRRNHSQLVLGDQHSTAPAQDARRYNSQAEQEYYLTGKNLPSSERYRRQLPQKQPVQQVRGGWARVCVGWGVGCRVCDV